MTRDGDGGTPDRSPVLSTHDRDEARRYITDVYIPHDLETRDGHRLDFKLRYLVSERITVGHLVYGADAELIVPSMVTCYHMNLTLHGQTMVGQSGGRAATRAGRSGVLFSPTDPFTVRWSPEAVQYAIKIPRRSLETHLARLIHRQVEEPVSFALGFDLTSGAGQSLLAAVHFLRNELLRPGGISTMPMARDQLESLVLTQVLLTVPNSYSDVLRAPDRPARRSKIRAAIELIEERPDSGLSPADLAESVGCTARALQRGFREAVGMSPMAYVRAVRLERVHQDLIAEAGRSSVTDIAMRWGFFHLGRFAQQYRDRFGVLPSETARRARLQGV
ncbi:AraC family transcriptional regulator [Actinacidiphila acididurans]|uniref:AraC family transcriptional regulator n=1 Tax=Actinacidiphila acididurans TaxID=2784346 RepID=A0ABS2U5R8_9ACTN|nr:AraC family transcriptional regulator [Actinacidiphila acididurans]MBM9510071.1 AraC family transcriptional regulator [Actinacidiphila acididurans]